MSIGWRGWTRVCIPFEDRGPTVVEDVGNLQAPEEMNARMIISVYDFFLPILQYYVCWRIHGYF